MDTSWTRYRKGALTRARLADAPGVVETMEGPVPYESGWFICLGVLGESWPLPPWNFEGPKAVFARVSDPDAQGYAGYRKTTEVEAQQQHEEFSTTLLEGAVIHGRPGDWLVREGSLTWIVAADVFAASYETV